MSSYKNIMIALTCDILGIPEDISKSDRFICRIVVDNSKLAGLAQKAESPLDESINWLQGFIRKIESKIMEIGTSSARANLEILTSKTGTMEERTKALQNLLGGWRSDLETAKAWFLSSLRELFKNAVTDPGILRSPEAISKVADIENNTLKLDSSIKKINTDREDLHLESNAIANTAIILVPVEQTRNTLAEEHAKNRLV